MDNNNPVVQQPEDSANNNKVVIWLIAGLLVVILVIGGIYWYLGKQPTTTPKSTPRPATTESNLDQELDSIDVQGSDSDFTLLDQDLQSL